MTAPNLFSLFEGYRAQADLDRADQQRAEAARAAQMNIDIQSRQEAEAEAGSQGRINRLQLEQNASEFALDDQPDALAAKKQALTFERVVQKSKVDAETPLLQSMAETVAKTQSGRAALGLKQVEFSLDMNDQQHNIERMISNERLDALQRQQVASHALTVLSKDSDYQQVLQEGARVAALMPLLSQSAQTSNMEQMNRVGAQLGLKFRISLDNTGTIEASPVGAETYSRWMGQESVPGWASMQQRKALLEERETRRAEAELVRQQNLAHQMEQEKLQRDKQEEIVRENAREAARSAAKNGAVSAPIPNLVTGAAAAAPAPAPTAAQAPRPTPTRLQQPPPTASATPTAQQSTATAPATPTLRQPVALPRGARPMFAAPQSTATTEQMAETRRRLGLQ